VFAVIVSVVNKILVNGQDLDSQVLLDSVASCNDTYHTILVAGIVGTADIDVPRRNNSYAFIHVS